VVFEDDDADDTSVRNSLKVTPVVGVVPPELVLRAKEVEGAELVVRRSVGTVNLIISHDLPNE
jgi:hypothetical protein